MKRRGSTFDDLVLLPWPAALVVGVFGFVVVRYGLGAYFSSWDNGILKGLGSAAARGAFEPIAWMVLGICWVAALVSFFRSRSRRRLLDHTRAPNDLRAIPWHRFEQLVGELFRRRGYAIEETGLGGADGGIDLVLRRGDAKEIVQCKQWKNAQVGVRVVRELYGLLHDSGASQAWIVCCGGFTADARRFAKDKPLTLITGDELLREITAVQDTTTNVSQAQEPPSPACPQCAASMRLRRNRRSGEQFWGCSGYPACRGTRAFGEGGAG